MPKSQNGWTVLDDAPPIADLIPGVLRLRVRPGDVAVIFSELTKRIHNEVERVDTGTIRDDWGWAYRAVRGQETGFSNHASGTAIDINALQHGRGRRNTWTREQVQEIDNILEYFEGVIRWGEHYSTVVDGMHFEINRGADDVRRVANKIRTKNMQTNNPPVPVEEIENMPKFSDDVDLGGAFEKFVKAHGVDPEAQTLDYEWFVKWGYVAQVQTLEAVKDLTEAVKALTSAVAEEDEVQP